MTRTVPGLCLGVLVLCTQTAIGQQGDDPFTEQELRGRRIYVEGEAESGVPITAIVSRGGTPVPASILPCVGCHGEDGKGRPEGGVVPPDITWQSLGAPYGHEHDYGRKHPAFDESSVARAVILGIDPAGNALDAAMPRYEMPEAEMADLVAYLKRISDDLDPGLTSTEIRIGSVLPLSGDDAPLGQAMQKVLEAEIADINRAGGIHGRRLALATLDGGSDALDNLWRVRDALRGDEIFALVSGYAPGADAELAAMAEELEVPMIGLLTPNPRPGNGLERHSFYLTGGLAEQARVLVRHALGEPGNASNAVGIVHISGAAYDSALAAVKQDLKRRNLPVPVVVSYQPPYLDKVDLVNTMRSRGVSTILMMTPADEVRRFAKEAGRAGYAPTILLPGVFAGRPMFEVGDEFTGRVLVGYPSIPSDHTPDGVRDFEALHANHEFGFEYSSAQISAFVAMRVFNEGLKRAGRALSREKLLIALEGVADFRPGLMPPISYNRSRRIGAYGGYVMELDLAAGQFGRASNWIGLEL